MELTVAEQMLYSTVKLTSLVGGSPTGTGTGFFVGFNFGQDKNVVVLITNKHVVRGSDAISVTCHIAKENKPSGQYQTFYAPNRPDIVIDHPNPAVDLCAIIFGPILNEAHQSGRPIFFFGLRTDLIPAEDDWAFYDAIEDVTMIGCPRGISDEVNNLPIVRSGITATSLSKLYNGKPEFMVDMACFPGSSGSPIFLFNKNGYVDRKRNNYMMGSTRLQLVGVLYSGPLVTNNGELVLNQIPKVSVQSMMHLGNAIRASEILVIEKEIKRRLGL